MSEEKSVLLCCNSDIGRGNTIGFRFGKVAKILQSEGRSFDILARDNFDEELEVKTPFYKSYLARFFNALRIYLFPELDFRYLDVKLFDRFVLRELKKRGARYDIAHFGEYIPRSIAYLKRKGVKIFLDIPIAHYSYGLYLKEMGYRLDSKPKRSERFIDGAIDSSDVLIAPSSFVRESVRRGGFDRIPVEVAPFGADSSGLEREDIEKRLEKRPLRFIFAGSVNFRKGVNFLLEAWQRADFSGAELLICGRLYKTIKRELGRFNLRGVKFLGFVDLDEFLRKSHVFVFPTLLEGSAKAVYEAMSYGLPVITTENAGSIVEDGQSGFIVPIGDVRALVEKISYFYENPEKIKEFGMKGLEKIEGYSWEKYGEKVIDVYKKHSEL